ncbi:MAG: hypothetical protein H6859_01445 [Rhodospirillales bacterium]|nr:MAG: hypothetical protein H6859_01445 [Rhodospirillales bacterium]
MKIFFSWRNVMLLNSDETKELSNMSIAFLAAMAIGNEDEANSLLVKDVEGEISQAVKRIGFFVGFGGHSPAVLPVELLKELEGDSVESLMNFGNDFSLMREEDQRCVNNLISCAPCFMS